MTHTDAEAAVLDALAADPADALSWFALADLLEESGRAAESELLRCLRLLSHGTGADDLEGAASRAAELMAAGTQPFLLRAVNSVGMEFVLADAGAFLMGSPEDEPGRDDDERQHAVIISKPYWVGVTPVTQAQWRAVTGENPSHFRRGGPGGSAVAGLDDAVIDRLPVESVSWDDCQVFLAKLSEMDGMRYRLPTEAEWEYACRGGHVLQGQACQSLPFHAGAPSATLSSLHANFDGTSPMAGAEPGPRLGRTSPVGAYPPNALGMYDVHGNVWEWCQDWYGPYPGGDVVPDLQGNAKASRGGAHDSRSPAVYCRAAFRTAPLPGWADETDGLRVVVDPRGAGGDADFRVTRSSVFHDRADGYLRTASRMNDLPYGRGGAQGLRVAVDPLQSEPTAIGRIVRGSGLLNEECSARAGYRFFGAAPQVLRSAGIRVAVDPQLTEPFVGFGRALRSSPHFASALWGRTAERMSSGSGRVIDGGGLRVAV